MNKIIVLQSDFSRVDGAVNAMEAVIYGVDPTLKISHLTHDITPYNIFEGSYRLFQTFRYWGEGTVFVSVVDPGVGTARKSVVAKTKGDKYIVTPNNGTLSYIKDEIVEVREISKDNYLKGSDKSYTFHGRDVFAYNAARLASGMIKYEDIGEIIPLDEIVVIPPFEVEQTDTSVKGTIEILDIRFGSLWTNITYDYFDKLNVQYGDMLNVTICNGNNIIYQNKVKYCHAFGETAIGSPILYINSVYCIALAINQGSFAKAYNIGTGKDWTIQISK